jgi:hypothetical protein
MTKRKSLRKDNLKRQIPEIRKQNRGKTEREINQSE